MSARRYTMSEILAGSDVDNRLAQVRDLIDRAGSGHLAPRVAFKAFEQFARDEGVQPKSAASLGLPNH